MSELANKVALVTGGSRGIGAAIAKRLAADGASVAITYAKDAGAASAVVKAIELGGGNAIAIQADAANVAAVKGAVEKAVATFGRLDVLVNNVGTAIPKPFEETTLTHGRTDLSKAMAGSKVVFHVAALFKMWGPEPLVNIDERLPVQQRSFAPYSASKAAAEQILLAANGRRDGFQTVALRPTMIWGTGMPMLDRMVEVVKAGNWQWPNGGTHAMSTCHINNLVDALLLAVDRGHGAYFVADAQEVTLRTIVTDLLATRGVKAGDKSVSFGMAWMLAGVMGFFWILFNLKGEPPVTPQMLRLVGKPFTVNISKARRELGYVPRVSWKQGIAEMQSSV